MDRNKDDDCDAGEFDRYFDVDEISECHTKKPTYLKSFATYFEVSKKAIVLHKHIKYVCILF